MSFLDKHFPTEEPKTPEERLIQELRWYEQAKVVKDAEGQKHHGGMLHRKPAIYNAIEEHLDMGAYLFELLRDIKQAIRIIDAGIESKDSDLYLQSLEIAKNLLTTGNEAGNIEGE